ncbi:MAG: L-histidine N(alpha)-methyltransferase [Flavobacteriaceae bacterium]
MSQFKKDVEEGLGRYPKSLPSKYFYDKDGDVLFERIMQLPEYYLTRAELEIFQQQAKQLVRALGVNQQTYFELIELGAGNGLKTKELLHSLQRGKYRFDYFPVDISLNALELLEKSLKEELPTLNIRKQHGDYFGILSSLKKTKHPKVIMFLGSNIGNMEDGVASQFLYGLGANLAPGDKLLLGVDLIKDTSIVLPAYNDRAGVTRDFNLNLLKRINRELGGNFEVDKFEHRPEYTQSEGIAKSFLVAKAQHNVHISALDKTFTFQKGERIATEISRKYDDGVLGAILKDTDFQIVGKLMDAQGYFADYILSRN